MNRLPIYEKKNEILQALKGEEQCIILSGQTGCGKSTQLPIIIHKEDKESKILCTQPRRVACTNIARRVAKELQYDIGQEIGFHIGKQPQYNENTKIIFITTGILMNYLIYEPQKLSKIDYLILDEVHERSVELDFVFLILKGTLHMHKHLKVVLMSATLGKNKLQIFFGQQNCRKTKIQKRLQQSYQKDDSQQYALDNPKHRCASVAIEQKMKYNVSTYYINTLDQFKGFKSDYIKLYANKYMNYKKALLVKEFLYLSLELIKHILYLESQNKLRSYGIFLIFLPGLAEIVYYKKMLLQQLQNLEYKNFDIIQMHSKLMQDQDTNQFSSDRTYFIIATNIAESSITIPNVRYIIDFCLVKQQNFQDRVSFLELGWSSKSSMKQRKGRTGRCNNGYFFAMINYDFYKDLYEYSEPDILRVPLDKIVLQINTIRKNLSKNKANNLQQGGNVSESNFDLDFIYEIFKNPYNFFSLAIEKITLKRIEDSIHYLLKNHAIIQSEVRGIYNNTFFGCIYQTLPCSLQLAQLIMYGKYLGCVEEAIICVSIIDSHKNIFKSTKNMEEKEIENFYKMQNYYSQSYNCDYIIRINIYKDWCKQFGITDWQKHKISKWKNILLQLKNDGFYQEWLQQNYILLDGMISIFEYYYLIKKNLQNTNRDFLKDQFKPEYIIKPYERLKLCFLLTFFPNIAQITQQESHQYERDYSYLQQHLNLNAKYTLKIENRKFTQFLNDKNKFLDMEEIDEARKTYIKRLQKILDEKYGDCIHKCQFIGEECMVQFKQDIAIEKIREILFLEKLQRKEQYSLKLFSFINGAQVEDFELQPNLLVKKDKPYLEIGEFNMNEDQKIKDEQINLALQMVKLTYFDYFETHEALTWKPLYVQSQSFNNTLIFPNVKQQQNLFLVSDNYKQDSKDKKCLQYSSLIHQYKNIFETLLILNSKSKDHKYCKQNNILKTINYKYQEYDVQKWYLKEDISQIRNLRNKIIYSFENFNSDFIKTFENDLVNILDKNRYSYIFDEQWFDNYREECEKKQNYQKEENENQYQMIEGYFKYKQQLLEKQEFMKKLSQLGRPQLVCGKCQNYICQISQIEIKRQKFCRNLKTKELSENQKVQSKMISKLTLENYQKQLVLFENFEYAYFCPLDHLIALQKDNCIKIPDFLKYKIQYPDGSIQNFDTFDFNYETILKQDQICQKNKDQYLKDYECKICYEQQDFGSYYELYKHFESNEHKEEEKYFKKKLNQLSLVYIVSINKQNFLRNNA